MSGEIPSLNIQPQVSVGAYIDNSGVHSHYAKLFSDIGNTLGKVAQQGANKEAAEAGAAEGMQPGFQPSAGIGETAQHYNEAGLQANRYVAGAQAMDTVNALAEKASQNISPESIHEFQNSAMSAGEGVLQAVPAQNRPYIQQLLAHQSATAHLKLQNALVAKQRTEAVGVFKGSFNQYLNATTDAFHNGDTNGATSLYAHTVKGIDDLVQSGAISAKQGFIYKNSATQNFHTAHASAGLQEIFSGPGTLEEKNAKATQYISSVATNPEIEKHFSPIQIKSLTRSLQTQTKDFQTRDKIEKVNTKKLQDDINTGAYTTGKVDPGKLAELQSKLPPDKFVEAQVETNLYQNLGATINEIKSSDLDTAQKALSEIQEKARNVDWSAPNAKGTNAIISKAQADAQRIMNDKLKNPALYAMQTPAYLEAKKKSDQDPQNYPPGKLPQQILDIEKQWGYPQDQQSVLPQTQAKTIAMNVNSQTPQKLVKTLQDLKKQYHDPYTFNIATQDLRKAGMKTDFSIMNSVLTNPETQARANDVMQSQMTSLKDYHSELTKLGKGTFQKVQQACDVAMGVGQNHAAGFFGGHPTTNGVLGVLEEQGGYNPAHFAGIQEGCYKLASYDMWSGKQTDARKAAQSAADTILNSHYSIGKYNGASYFVPKRDSNNIPIDGDHARAALKVVAQDTLPQGIEPPAEYMRGVSDDRRRKLYTQDLVDTGIWKQKGNDGLVFCDSTGTPVQVNIDGKAQPLIVNNNDFNDPSSRINSMVNARASKIGGNPKTAMKRIVNSPSQGHKGFIDQPWVVQEQTFANITGLTMPFLDKLFMPTTEKSS